MGNTLREFHLGIEGGWDIPQVLDVEGVSTTDDLEGEYSDGPYIDHLVVIPRIDFGSAVLHGASLGPHVHTDKLAFEGLGDLEVDELDVAAVPVV